MVEKLSKLYNTLLLIETKGESTKHMGACIQFVEQLIAEAATVPDTQKEETE